MKTYTFKRQGSYDSVPTVQPGLDLKEDKPSRLSVILGERGDRRYKEEVSVDRKVPPKIHDGYRVLQCQAHYVEARNRRGKIKRFYTLRSITHLSNDRIVHICTRGFHQVSGYDGFIEIVEGIPERLTYGYGAYGRFGHLGHWIDALYILHPGDEVKVTLSGEPGSSFRIWCDDEGVYST